MNVAFEWVDACYLCWFCDLLPECRPFNIKYVAGRWDS